ncbi:MAG: hypothetical protein L6461_08210 [Anaerolineae bacterium]|nr:hypothetical protein [Anaerolineae bacterium]
MNRKFALRLLLVCLGIGMIVVAFFAFQLGLDNNPEWGPRRFQIAGLGAFVILWGLMYWISPSISRIASGLAGKPAFLNRKIKGNGLADWRFIHIIRQSSFVQTLARHRTNIFLVLLVLLALWSYLWILTAGRLEEWPSGKNYYNLLARAFQNGQLHLLLEPSAELLALENPYDYHNRENVPHLWDASLYQGKYYLYWGPVPALIGALVSAATSRPVTDAGLVLGFSVATVFFGILLLKKLWQDFHYPAWLFWGTCAALAFNTPMLWLLTRPSVYEASISGGQAFGIAGLFFGYCALRNASLHKRYLVLTGLFLGLAGGTRTNLLISAAVLAALLAYRLLHFYGKQIRELMSALLTLGIPLALVFAALLGYNYARFGSIFEFGHRYQLTGPALPANYQEVSSVEYILPNAYTYILRSPDFSSEFPFVSVPWVKEKMWPSFIRLPENYYYSEPTAGILFLVPLVGLTVLFLLRFFWLLLDGEIHFGRKVGQQGPPMALSWLSHSLLAYVLIQLAILLVFISSSLRYLFDITPALILLSSLFVAANLKNLAQKTFQERLLAFSWLLISGLSMLSGILIGLTGSSNHFANHNPQLFESLLNWFR